MHDGHTHIYIYIYMHKTNTYTYTYTHIYIYTCINIYTQTPGDVMVNESAQIVKESNA